MPSSPLLILLPDPLQSLPGRIRVGLISAGYPPLSPGTGETPELHACRERHQRPGKQQPEGIDHHAPCHALIGATSRSAPPPDRARGGGSGATPSGALDRPRHRPPAVQTPASSCGCNPRGGFTLPPGRDQRKFRLIRLPARGIGMVSGSWPKALMPSGRCGAPGSGSRSRERWGVPWHAPPRLCGEQMTGATGEKLLKSVERLIRVVSPIDQAVEGIAINF